MNRTAWGGRSDEYLVKVVDTKKGFREFGTNNNWSRLTRRVWIAAPRAVGRPRCTMLGFPS